jgi:hypothetical protein
MPYRVTCMGRFDCIHIAGQEKVTCLIEVPAWADLTIIQN